MLAKVLRGNIKTVVKEKLGGKGRILSFSAERNPRDHPIQIVSTLHFVEGNGDPDR